MNSPMPTPPNLRRSPASPWKNRSKIRSWSPSAMPMPSSSTVTSIHSPVSNGPFDLAAVLHGAAAAFRPLSDKHAVVADVPAGLPPASGDTMATDIIVGQLLENAFKYSPDGGTVRVRAAA